MDAWKFVAVATGFAGLSIGFVTGRMTAPTPAAFVSAPPPAVTAPLAEPAVPSAPAPAPEPPAQLTMEGLWAVNPTLPEVVNAPDLIAVMLEGAPGPNDEAAQRAWPADLDFATLSRNPNRHKQSPAVFSGTVDQVIEEDNGVTHMRISLRSYGRDTIWATTQHPVPGAIRDGSRVRIYGRVLGQYTYTSQAQHEISLPAILVSAIILR